MDQKQYALETGLSKCKIAMWQHLKYRESVSGSVKHLK